MTRHCVYPSSVEQDDVYTLTHIHTHTHAAKKKKHKKETKNQSPTQYMHFFEIVCVCCVYYVPIYNVCALVCVDKKKGLCVYFPIYYV